MPECSLELPRLLLMSLRLVQDLHKLMDTIEEYREDTYKVTLDGRNRL